METVSKLSCIKRGGQLDANPILGAQQVIIGWLAVKNLLPPMYRDKAAQK